MSYLFAIIIGLVIGSFLNCLIWRLYKDESLWGRSYCPKCRHKINWYDNIPLLSFVILRGKCRYCQKKISWQYPMVELMTAILFVLSFSLQMNNSQLLPLILRDWFLIVTLIVVFVYDWRWQLIPMHWLWPMTGFLFIINLILGVVWWQILLGGAGFALFFLIQYFITKRKGIGEGDIWLGVFLGISFPYISQLALIIVISYLLGATLGIVLLLKKRKGLKSKIALGPFLALGAVVTLLYGANIINWYLSLAW